MLRLQLCSARYTALQSKNNKSNFSAMNPVATENVGKKHNTARGKPYRAIANLHLVLSVKRTGIQRRTKVSP